MSTLERAIAIAAEAHTGQIDKAGMPYILHPIRVMLRVKSNEERIAAVLHDVIEDCPDWNEDRLRQEGFAESIIEAVVALTKRPGEDYEQFVLRAASHPIARRVKVADLQDNSDLSRIANPTEKDRARIQKYTRALEVIRNLPE